MKRGFIQSAPLLLLLGACDGNDAPGPDSGRESSAPRALPVQVAAAALHDLSRSIQVSGPVEPMRTIRLAARTDGVLTDVAVEEGDPVGEGQIIARIDVREQQAELARARAILNEKRTNFERIQPLRANNHIDQASFESARAELEVAQSEVRLWETRVDFGNVRASIDGTVVSRHVEPGEAISRHEPLFSLADLSGLVVRLGVSELDVHHLTVDQHVMVRVDAVAEHNPLTGVIRRIFPATEGDSRLITVEVQIPEAGRIGVRPGYLARAELVVDRRPEVLAIPAASVARAGGEYYVMLVNGESRLQRRIIEPGVIRGPWREVIAGLESGEQVVAANPQELTEGEPVRIVAWSR